MSCQTVERGIRANPDHWSCILARSFISSSARLQGSRESFRPGSKIPGVHPWMKVMTAAMAARAETFRLRASVDADLRGSDDNDPQNALSRSLSAGGRRRDPLARCADY